MKLLVYSALVETQDTQRFLINFIMTDLRAEIHEVDQTSL